MDSRFEMPAMPLGALPVMSKVNGLSSANEYNLTSFGGSQSPPGFFYQILSGLVDGMLANNEKDHNATDHTLYRVYPSLKELIEEATADAEDEDESTEDVDNDGQQAEEPVVSDKTDVVDAEGVRSPSLVPYTPPAISEEDPCAGGSRCQLVPYSASIPLDSVRSQEQTNTQQRQRWGAIMILALLALGLVVVKERKHINKWNVDIPSADGYFSGAGPAATPPPGGPSYDPIHLRMMSDLPLPYPLPRKFEEQPIPRIPQLPLCP